MAAVDIEAGGDGALVEVAAVEGVPAGDGVCVGAEGADAGGLALLVEMATGCKWHPRGLARDNEL